MAPPVPPRHPAPCLPPPGMCPGHRHDPIMGRFAITPDQENTDTIPTLTITEATPIPSPPAYITSSPPKYAALPSNTTEQTLLLAPPPFYIDIDSESSSTGCRRCDVDVASHARHTCGRDRDPKADYIKWILIFLNVAVWSAVIWGYYVEWKDPGSWTWCGFGPASSALGGVRPICVGPSENTPSYASLAPLEVEESWVSSPSGVTESCVGQDCYRTDVEC